MSDQQPATDRSLSTRRLYSGPRRGDYSDASIAEMHAILRGLLMFGKPMLRRDVGLLVPVTIRKVKRLLQAMAGWGLVRVVNAPGYTSNVKGWDVTERGWGVAVHEDEQPLRDFILEELEKERARKPKPKRFAAKRATIIKGILEQGALVELEKSLLSRRKSGSKRAILRSPVDNQILAIVWRDELKEAQGLMWREKRAREMGVDLETGLPIVKSGEESE